MANSVRIMSIAAAAILAFGAPAFAGGKTYDKVVSNPGKNTVTYHYVNGVTKSATVTGTLGKNGQSFSCEWKRDGAGKDWHGTGGCSYN